jgi:hypothetical protein
MTEKEKIREEIEKLKSQLLRGACSSQIAMETRCKEEAYNEVLAILDTTQEEPKFKIGDVIRFKGNEILEEEEKTHKIVGYDNELYIFDDGTTDLFCEQELYELVKEPVSEDLEEASKNYALNNTPWDDCKDEIQESFKAGAKWQKAKDESTTEDLGEYINELSKQFPEVSFAKLSRIAVRVAKWQKKQMMAKAVDGYVIKDVEEGNGDFLLSADYLPKTMGLKDQQRVKVIVIKKN